MLSIDEIVNASANWRWTSGASEAIMLTDVRLIPNSPNIRINTAFLVESGYIYEMKTPYQTIWIIDTHVEYKSLVFTGLKYDVLSASVAD